MELFVGTHGPALAHAVFAVIGLWLAAIDHATHRLPDVIVLPMWLGSVAWFRAVSSVSGDTAAWEGSVVVTAGAVVVLLLMAEAPGQPLGYGDVKLGGVIATHLGWHGAETAAAGFAWAFAWGGMWALWLLGRRRVGLHGDVAFGPWLVAGYLCAIIQAYSQVSPGEII